MHAAPNRTDRDALLTEAQAADFLNLSVRTLQAWRIKLSGPDFVRAGRAIRYRRSDLIRVHQTNPPGLFRREQCPA